VNAKDRSIIRFVAAMEDQKLIMVANCSEKISTTQFAY